ncbi:MAG: GNAT family N-acetyltransferase [Nocardioidaceae bacterium]|nr:GNAT family N-acetyltransferase [Nocardioidaceae bacterium]
MTLTLRPIEADEVDEVDEVQALIEADPGYVERITGLPPGPADAQSLLMVVPPDLPPDRKTVYGVRDGSGPLVGLVDVLRGYPDEATAYLGLLQVHADHQRRGLGTRAHAALLEVVRGWPEITSLMLSIVATNRVVAEPFWVGLGYRPVGEPMPYAYANLASTVQRYGRPLG